MNRRSMAMISVLLAAAAVPVAAQTVSIAISTAVASSDRPDADRARDAGRKPAEMLAFAGVQPGQKVAEYAPGGGYFTRLLSLAVGPSGKVYGLSSKPAPAVDEWAKTHANTAFRQLSPGVLPVTESVDLVWTTENYHDFKNIKMGDSDAAAHLNRAAFMMLKPGGIYLVSDHAAAAGTGASATSTLHRIDPDVVTKEVEAAGFKLDGSSDILRNSADDHSLPVFDDKIRGKTDQFVLRFKKPA